MDTSVRKIKQPAEITRPESVGKTSENAFSANSSEEEDDDDEGVRPPTESSSDPQAPRPTPASLLRLRRRRRRRRRRAGNIPPCLQEQVPQWCAFFPNFFVFFAWIDDADCFFWFFLLFLLLGGDEVLCFGGVVCMLIDLWEFCAVVAAPFGIWCWSCTVLCVKCAFGCCKVLGFSLCGVCVAWLLVVWIIDNRWISLWWECWCRMLFWCWFCCWEVYSLVLYALLCVCWYVCSNLFAFVASAPLFGFDLF